ncbi:hypothetical protein [Leyella stercorea]|uniref:hypothetical protein n=1 Tax=Leyella stercorea TaxID=363265 RepID=UPI002431CEFF|nr:hypothetical protein [Leyella stercorea]
MPELYVQVMWHVADPHRPTQMSASTDADVRIDRCRCSYRPMQMSVSTDADVRVDRRRWIFYY